MKKILCGILIFLIILFGFLLYSRFIGTKGLDVNEYVINREEFILYDGLKIVHFSDLHYKKVILEEDIVNLVKAINKTEPDLVLFTGDLLDKDYVMESTDINFLIEELSKIESKYGVYSVLGDNDEEYLDIIRNIYIQSNIILLDNSDTTVFDENNNKLKLVGISGDIGINDEINISTNDKEQDYNYQIIMTHKPDNIDKILAKYPTTPLILSGHSINGSINIPFIKQALLPDGATKYYDTYYNVNGTDIYISNGIGVNEFNFRFLNTPSINLYRFKKSN